MDPHPQISGLSIFLTLFLVLLNGFFVAAEFAIVKVRGSQIEIKAKTGSKVAQIAKHMTSHLDGYLAATQLGITLASLGLGWVGEKVMSSLVAAFFSFISLPISASLTETLGLILAFTIITILHIVFGELAPKTLAIQKPVATTMAIAFPLQFFYIIFKPFIYILNGFANVILKLVGIDSANAHEAIHSSEELQYLLDQGKESGAIDKAEHELIKNVFDFNERVVKNIMVPRTKISAIELTATQEELLDCIISEGYSRIPVYDDTIDRVVGIVHAKDILSLIVKHGKFNLNDILRKPLFVPESKKINDLMAELKLKRIQIAIVLDEFGGTAGMVTLEDIVEELVGDIQDEYDEEKPLVEKVSEDEFIVTASATVYDVNEFLPHDLPEDEDYDTVAGLLSEIFGKIPEVGETKDFNGYTFTILKKIGQNIEAVKLQLIIEEEEQVDNH
ncbi:HlyC/CorC family transporter [Pedobacter sp. SD-b]|uniref:HlyC/CorC family transporter n=1 Tax=Pedobacter segetis TaxID=2793069 RepID=A0ABS1BIT3_9SPHI|nr:hemolysin family protein [Pedobacter segetis]MBK0382271.1 HlyC/CorC family transporter [Pedobacter segetis]